MEKYCKCFNCKHPHSHLTSYHKCGKCGSFGHGFVECHQNNNGSYDKQNSLHESCYRREKIYDHNNGTYYTIQLIHTHINSEDYCKVKSCKTRFTHSTGSHHPFFSEDEYGGASGPDTHCVRRRYNEILKKGPEIIKKYNNAYIAMYWGMGNMFVFRNIDGVIEKLETEGDYSHFVKGLRQIKE